MIPRNHSLPARQARRRATLQHRSLVLRRPCRSHSLIIHGSGLAPPSSSCKQLLFARKLMRNNHEHPDTKLRRILQNSRTRYWRNDSTGQQVLAPFIYASSRPASTIAIDNNYRERWRARRKLIMRATCFESCSASIQEWLRHVQPTERTCPNPLVSRQGQPVAPHKALVLPTPTSPRSSQASTADTLATSNTLGVIEIIPGTIFLSRTTTTPEVAISGITNTPSPNQSRTPSRLRTGNPRRFKRQSKRWMAGLRIKTHTALQLFRQ